MLSKFIELTELDSGVTKLVNTQKIFCLSPHLGINTKIDFSNEVIFVKQPYEKVKEMIWSL